MQPDKKLITIKDNKKLISDFIYDMIIRPRQNAHKWSATTNQTPNLKTGYPSQHLASLITGMKGTASGARGNDICDGSEVKACSKVDQSDKCQSCKNNVLRTDKVCPYCGSDKIKRNNDSKWLISVRSKDELRMLLEETPRFVFLVTDYPNFDKDDYNDIRIRAFEVWMKSDRARNYRELLDNYYNYIYLPHIKANPNQTPAPKNLFPDNFPFYMCNPIKTFECIIKDSLTEKAKLDITHYVEPDVDRSDLASELMPASLLSKPERNVLLAANVGFTDKTEFVTEDMRKALSLRDTDKAIKTIGTKQHKF